MRAKDKPLARSPERGSVAETAGLGEDADKPWRHQEEDEGVAKRKIDLLEAELPGPGASDEQWSTFKAAMFDLVVDAIRLCDQECDGSPATGRHRLRQIRRKHHLIVIADRIRRSSPAGRQPAGDALEKAASLVLCHRGSASGRASKLAPRTRREERLLLSARVSWHKLSRIAGVQPPVPPDAPRRQSARRGAALLRAIAQPGLAPEARARILEDHISGRIDQLVSVVREAMLKGEFSLSKRQQSLIRDIEALQRRARNRVAVDRG